MKRLDLQARRGAVDAQTITAPRPSPWKATPHPAAYGPLAAHLLLHVEYEARQHVAAPRRDRSLHLRLCGVEADVQDVGVGGEHRVVAALDSYILDAEAFELGVLNVSNRILILPGAAALGQGGEGRVRGPGRGFGRGVGWAAAAVLRLGVGWAAAAAAGGARAAVKARRAARPGRAWRPRQQGTTAQAPRRPHLAVGRPHAPLLQHVHTLRGADDALARHESKGAALQVAGAGEREQGGVDAGHGVADLAHECSLAAWQAGERRRRVAAGDRQIRGE
jgi:hypothetical protein